MKLSENNGRDAHIYNTCAVIYESKKISNRIRITIRTRTKANGMIMREYFEVFLQLRYSINNATKLRYSCISIFQKTLWSCRLKIFFESGAHVLFPVDELEPVNKCTERKLKRKRKNTTVLINRCCCKMYLKKQSRLVSCALFMS